MPVELYEILHVLGILLLFTSYGALIARAYLGSDDVRLRKLGGVTSGVGLFLVLLGGFGLQAKYHIGFPAWLWVKIVIWIVLGAMLVWINRKPQLALPLFWATLGLGFIAVLMVVLKPF